MVGAIAAGVVPLYAILMLAYGATPETIDVGYRPVQPIPYSHKLHAGDLGIDCRYCHNTVESTAQASLPPTQTCMNCHNTIRRDSQLLTPLYDSYQSGKPIPWVRVHDLPDYVYFNHSAHVSRGVSCVSCHGRIDRMEVVYQAKPLSMGWCLECHRHPEPNLRPLDQITNLAWTPPAEADPDRFGAELREKFGIRPSQYMTSCSVCHR